MVNAFGDLKETVDGLQRRGAAGASSASHRSQVRASWWHGLGSP